MLVGFIGRSGAAGIIPFLGPGGTAATQKTGSNAGTAFSVPQSFDLEAFRAKVASPGFQTCAKQVIGDVRLRQLISGGELPTAAEILKLTPCLR